MSDLQTCFKSNIESIYFYFSNLEIFINSILHHHNMVITSLTYLLTIRIHSYYIRNTLEEGKVIQPISEAEERNL